MMVDPGEALANAGDDRRLRPYALLAHVGHPPEEERRRQVGEGVDCDGERRAEDANHKSRDHRAGGHRRCVGLGLNDVACAQQPGRQEVGGQRLKGAAIERDNAAEQERKSC